jgi:hypothetical protein
MEEKVAETRRGALAVDGGGEAECREGRGGESRAIAGEERRGRGVSPRAAPPNVN